jgi:hypothetical protein
VIEVPVRYYRRVVTHALIDAQDEEAICSYRWTLNPWGYASRSYGLDNYLMHREILGLRKGDGRISHHLNHDKLDNRRANLRVCASQFEHYQYEHPRVGTTFQRHPDAPQPQVWRALFEVPRPVVAPIVEILGVLPLYAPEREEQAA